MGALKSKPTESLVLTKFEKSAVILEKFQKVEILKFLLLKLLFAVLHLENKKWLNGLGWQESFQVSMRLSQDLNPRSN